MSSSSSPRPARLPRYRRAKNPPAFRLTDRDVRILRYLYDLRLLDRGQIQRLEFTPAGTSACKRRLTLLFHHGYVDRRYAANNAPFGASRSAYCLDRIGAETLAARLGSQLRDLDWRADDARRDALFLDHLLDTNDMYISLRLACGASMTLDWLSERTLRRGLTGIKLASGVQVDGADLVPIPDAHAVITGAEQYAFAIELDKGTVEERRLRRKFVAYGEWLSSGAWSPHLPGPVPRVLFVVAAGAASASRLERLVRWCEAEGGRSLFWFAEHEDVVRSDVLRDAIWAVAGDNIRQRLLAVAPITIAPTLPRLR